MISENKLNDRIFSLVKWSCFLLLFGKGILHFTEEQPYTLLFSSEFIISYFIGVIFLIGAFVSILPKGTFEIRWMYYFFIMTSGLLLFHSYLTFVKANFLPEQLVEHSLQISLPILFLILYNPNSVKLKSYYFLLSILVGLTFVGHGVYALGMHLVPENFLTMTTKSLAINNEIATEFLFAIGILDVLFSLLLFIPRAREFAIFYMIIWGFLTSFARVYYVIDLGITKDLLTVNLPNTVYRLSHGIIPLTMFFIVREWNGLPKSEAKEGSIFSFRRSALLDKN